MFEQLVMAMSQSATQNAIGYSQQMMECTLKLTQSQIKVMEGLCDELSQEYRETLSSGDPSAIPKNWSSLMSTALRANTEAAALFMKNAKEYQAELLQMIPSSASGLPGQIINDMLEVVKTNGSTRQAVRAKKAA